MKYYIWIIILCALAIIYSILDSIEKNISKNKKNENIELKRTKIIIKTKKWERITTISILVVLFILFLFISLINKTFYSIYSFIYYIVLLIIYLLSLLNVLLNKKTKTSNKQLVLLINTPAAVNLLLNTAIINKLKNMISINTILYYIFSQTIKNFIILFFFILDITLILLKLKTMLQKLSTKKQKQDIDVGINSYIYVNARNKKGIAFLINYIKDILIFIKLYFIMIIKYCYNGTIKKLIIIIKTLLIKLTNIFSIILIFIIPFNISLIISLLITYYNLLNQYRENVITDFYSVVITTIIIPIILNIISDLKEK